MSIAQERELLLTRVRGSAPKEEAFEWGHSREPVKKGRVVGVRGDQQSQPVIGTKIPWASSARKSLSAVRLLALPLPEVEPPAPINECLTCVVHHSMSSGVLC